MIGRIRFDFDVRNTKKMQKISRREISVRAKLSWGKERIIEDDGKFRRRVEKDRK